MNAMTESSRSAFFFVKKTLKKRDFIAFSPQSVAACEHPFWALF
jgi:hypothetical protein